jgi:tetratricopeptide (TPR) repeat protein
MDINQAFQSAVNYYHSGDLHQSESLCRQIISEQPNHPNALYLMGLVCYGLAQYDAAIHYIQATLALVPSHTEAYTNLGNAFRASGQHDRAIDYYEKAINLNPHGAMPYNNIGYILEEKGQLDDAISHYQKAIELDPSLSFAHFNLAAILHKKKYLDDAIFHYRKALELDKEMYEAFTKIIEVLKEKNELTHNENNKIIHCIGDSHACFFSGHDSIHEMWPFYIGQNLPFKSYRIGSTLAYNLCALNTTTRGREYLFNLLPTLPQRSNILLIFGEVDCRAHIGKQADKQGLPVEVIIKECIDRYFSVILEIISFGFNVGVWGVHPSNQYIKCGPDHEHTFPVYGTIQERNNITRLFNNYLEDRCLQNSIQFVSIFEELINANLTAKSEYYVDDIHLSQKVCPLSLPKIKAAYAEVFQ